jgi:hypothetical protein
MNPTVKRRKLRLGLIYGMVAGLAFTVFAWGLDALLLSRANVTYYWIKFIPSLIVCVLSGGLVGWLTIRFEKHGIALLMWGMLAVLYSWLVIWMPFTGSSTLLIRIDPNLAHYLEFTEVKDLNQFRMVSLGVIGLAAILCGLLEINLIQQAALSSNILTPVASILVCIFLFGMAGSATDQLINSNLREPMQAVNNLLQFAADNEGVEVPKETARKMHLSTVNQLGGIIQKDYELTLIGFDENIGIVDILVDFEGTLVKCTAIYSQPTDCIILIPNP